MESQMAVIRVTVQPGAQVQLFDVGATAQVPCRDVLKALEEDFGLGRLYAADSEIQLLPSAPHLKAGEYVYKTYDTIMAAIRVTVQPGEQVELFEVGTDGRLPSQEILTALEQDFGPGKLRSAVTQALVVKGINLPAGEYVYSKSLGAAKGSAGHMHSTGDPIIGDLVINYHNMKWQLGRLTQGLQEWFVKPKAS